MTPRQHRLFFLVLVGGLFFIGVGLILWSLQENLLYFVTPRTLLQEKVGTHLRLGGLVQVGSIQRQGQDLTFIVRDEVAQVTVHYTGIVPDLFREGQGVVVEGSLQNGTFEATVLLAKHDERYLPASVVAELKEQGQWRP